MRKKRNLSKEQTYPYISVATTPNNAQALGHQTQSSNMCKAILGK